MKHPKARILIVEDDQAIRNGLSDVLVFNGYAVCGAEDGGEGLETILNACDTRCGQLQSSPSRRGIVSDRSGHKAVNSITGVATKIMSFSAGQTVS